MNKMNRNIRTYTLKDAFNRWIDLILVDGSSCRLYLLHYDQMYIGGYVSRRCFRTLTWSQLFPNDDLQQYHYAKQYCMNNWVRIVLSNGQSLHFYLNYVDENCIGGYFRKETLQGIDFSFITYQLFFEEYDSRFHPLLIPKNKQIPTEEKEYRIEVVKRAEPILVKRLQTRASLAQKGKIPDKNKMPRIDIKDLQYLSEKQLELYKEFFAEPDNGFNYQKTNTYFEFFSNGELAGTNYPGKGQPDSADYFIFAEFALHALECGIDKEIWSELLRTFVQTQEIFIRVYHPEGISTPKLFDYKYSNFKYYRQFSEAEKKKLKAKYSNFSRLELEQKYVENLRKAQFL